MRGPVAAPVGSHRFRNRLAKGESSEHGPFVSTRRPDLPTVTEASYRLGSPWLPSPSWLTRFAVVWVFLAPLGPSLHLVSSAHHLCHEHGEVEHDDHASGVEHHNEALSSCEHDAFAVAPGEAAHEHCDAIGLLQQASRTAPPIALAALVIAPEAPPDMRPCVSHAGPALLESAPKTSPPAAA